MTVATHEALAKMRAIVQACQEDPLAWISWLPVQASFLADPAAIKLLVASAEAIVQASGGKVRSVLEEVLESHSVSTSSIYLHLFRASPSSPQRGSHQDRN